MGASGSRAGLAGATLMTNDTTWRRKGRHTLDTGAWAHAKHLSLLEGGNWRGQAIKAAKEEGGDALARTDLAFVRPSTA